MGAHKNLEENVNRRHKSRTDYNEIMFLLTSASNLTLHKTKPERKDTLVPLLLT